MKSIDNQHLLYKEQYTYILNKFQYRENIQYLDTKTEIILRGYL